MRFTPCFSHGGSTDEGWTAVSGAANGAGLPIDIGDSSAEPANWPVLEIFITGAGGTATVTIEANGGELDSTFNPPAAEWIDISNGGYSMDSASLPNVAKRIPPNLPYVRTKVASIAGASTVVTSYIPKLTLASGQNVSPTHPKRSSTGVS